MAKASEAEYVVVEVPKRYRNLAEGKSKYSWKQGFNSLSSLLKINIKQRRLHFLIIIIIISCILRVLWLWNTLSLEVPLDPDAHEYMVLGEGLSKGVWIGSGREPLFPLIVALTFLISKPNVVVFRILTVILSIFIVYLSYRVARKYIKGTWERFLPPFLVATDFYLIFNSVRGLREELYAVLLMLLLLNVTWTDNKSSFWNYITSGFLSAMICLTKLEGIAVTTALAAFQLWFGSSNKRKIRGRLVTVILLSSILAVIGWMALCQILIGDPFATTTNWGSWWYSYEFGEVKAVTFFEYIFQYHSPYEVLTMMLFGAKNLTYKLAEESVLTPFGFTLLLLGFVFSMQDEKLLPLHFTLLGGSFPYAFFFVLNADYRLFYPFLPIIYLFVTFAVAYLKTPSIKTYSFRIFYEKKIRFSIYGLSLIPVILMIYFHIYSYIVYLGLARHILYG